MNTELLDRVPGGPELLNWFGYAPRFHDAEVLSVALDRQGSTCRLRVHAFEMTNEVDADGFFACTKHVIVTFAVGDLIELELVGFNSQNALMGLNIRRGLDAQFRIELESAYGLGGIVEGRTLHIELAPGVPEGSQYAR